MELVNLKKEEIKENSKISNLATSYLNFRKSLAKVSDKLKKNAIIRVGNYSYKYTELDTILSVINPLLLEHDLFIHQEYEKDEKSEYMKTILCHISGEERVFRTPFVHLDTKSMNNTQALGASLTYMRRYALGSIFALATEEDNDCAIHEELIRSDKEKSKIAKYSYYEYMLKFSKKLHKVDNIKTKPFSSLRQIELFEESLVNNDDEGIKRYFELNPIFKDIATWTTLIGEYISSTCSDMHKNLRSINKFYETKETCFGTSPIKLFSCLSKEKEFQYLFN